MGMQWDAEKSAANEAKHGISFLQAAQIFRGPILKIEDTRRDYGERRFIALGAWDGVVLRVVFTERDGDIRIISTWKASQNDRQAYHRFTNGSLSRSG
jgi:uncharacterized DUF497 family protein